MFKKANIVVVVAASLLLAWAGPTRATLIGLPKALKSPLDSLELTMPVWGPMSYNFSCVEHLDECQGQPKKASLFSLPKMLKPWACASAPALENSPPARAWIRMRRRGSSAASNRFIWFSPVMEGLPGPALRGVTQVCRRQAVNPAGSPFAGCDCAITGS